MFNKNNHPTIPGAPQPFAALRSISIFAVFLCLLIVVGTSYILYARVYERKSDVESIMSHRAEDLMHTINTGKLEKTLETWNSKHATGTIELPSNFFSSGPSTGAGVSHDIGR